MKKNIKISGVGCCLVDRVYNNVSFNSDGFEKYLSFKPGDGGLVAGNLVFREEFEDFSGLDLNQFVKSVSDDKMPDAINIGGPSIVALIHAAQMNQKAGCSYHFYGVGGEDSDGDFLCDLFKQIPVNTDAYELKGSVTPSTIVLSDPRYDHGNVERIFINSIGAAWDYMPEDLDDNFFESDVVVFGATALVPPIHDKLETLLGRAKSRGSLTIVNTVYDFRNEKANPDQKWPLGESDQSYAHIDLLVVDLEEACIWGVVSGGYACFYVGGTYLEKESGEKRRRIVPYYEKYQKQISE